MLLKQRRISVKNKLHTCNGLNFAFFHLIFAVPPASEAKHPDKELRLVNTR